MGIHKINSRIKILCTLLAVLLLINSNRFIFALGTPQITKIDPSSPSPVGTCIVVAAEVKWDSEFRSMRMRFGNEGWQEEATPELERKFCTGNYSPGWYKIRVEVARKGDGDWSHATSIEADYQLTGGGGSGNNSGNTGGGSRDGQLATSSNPINTKQVPSTTGAFTWPLEITSLKDGKYFGGFFGFGSRINYNPASTVSPCTQAYSNNGYYFVDGRALGHTGKDMAIVGATGSVPSIYEQNPQVFAVADGRVIDVQHNLGGYGSHILIYHIIRDASDPKNIKDYERYSLYAHLHKDSIRVQIGQLVHKGDWIARYDHTGNWGGQTHLHFEIRKTERPSTCSFGDNPISSDSVWSRFEDPEVYLTKMIATCNATTSCLEQQAQNIATSLPNTQTVHTQSGTLKKQQTTERRRFDIRSTLRMIWNLLFPGSELELNIYKPDGSLYRSIHTQTSLQFEIENPIPGFWEYTVRAIDIPYEDYPFAVAVAVTDEPAIDTGEVEDGDTGTPLREDITAPQTNINFASPTPTGKNGWYIDPVIISAAASDDLGGETVTLLSTNGGKVFKIYAQPIIFDTEGVSNIVVYSVDAMGNVEQKQEHTLKIDMTLPIVQIFIDQPEYTRVDSFIVHYSGYDPEPGSGLWRLIGSFNGQDVNNNQNIDLFWSDLNVYSLSATAEDYAGWTNQNRKSFKLIATVESLQATVARLCAENYVTNKGICNSLAQKLESALASRNAGQIKTAINKLNAFVDEVKAQSEKHIPAKAARILIMDSNFVLSVLNQAIAPTPAPQVPTNTPIR